MLDPLAQWYEEFADVLTEIETARDTIAQAKPIADDELHELVVQAETVTTELLDRVRRLLAEHGFDV